ncbi:MAG: helix-turn-helix transcriptional regulator [Bacteroidaceae bacterium]|nr:helix-turn-helix transcriptional regulator [Bacteroidaceae bacterium]
MHEMSKKLYSPTDKMGDLICDNYSLLQVMSRFDLPLGFGDYSVEEVCKSNSVDCRTFLAVVNFINKGYSRTSFALEDISIQSLMNYLKKAHHYFLDFQLPNIRRKLLEAIDCSMDNDVTFLILRFFDGYVQEVRKHMNYEDMYVFTYVEHLLQGQKDEEYCIDMFVRHHDHIDEKLTELKNSIIKYYPANQNAHVMNAVLFDIFNCEKDLASHNKVEDYLFVPAVLHLEKEVASRVHEVPKVETVEVNEQEEVNKDIQDDLSQREKEIITCVVKGMSNKEIAEYLYISIHTVITHRRNIARKLQIHSPTLLTVYAIVNKLVDISEVKVSI